MFCVIPLVIKKIEEGKVWQVYLCLSRHSCSQEEENKLIPRILWLNLSALCSLSIWMLLFVQIGRCWDVSDFFSRPVESSLLLEVLNKTASVTWKHFHLFAQLSRLFFRRFQSIFSLIWWESFRRMSEIKLSEPKRPAVRTIGQERQKVILPPSHLPHCFSSSRLCCLHFICLLQSKMHSVTAAASPSSLRRNVPLKVTAVFSHTETKRKKSVRQWKSRKNLRTISLSHVALHICILAFCLSRRLICSPTEHVH